MSFRTKALVVQRYSDGDQRPLRVALDPSVCGGLRNILLRDPALFVLADETQADCILFGTDDLRYLSQNDNHRRYRSKCFCISESDIPSFAMPGLFAANRRGLLTRRRAATISYCISLRYNRNKFLDREYAIRTPKTLLYSFMGGVNSWPRRRLLRHVLSRHDTHIEATDRYDHWARDRDDAAERQQRRYSEVMSSSKFIVCPRGCGISSYRLFEAMALGVAPVIISDAWRPIRGIDWSFALFVAERDVAKLDSIIRAHEHEWLERGEAAYAAHVASLGDETIAATLRCELDRVRQARRWDREVVMSTYAKSRVLSLRAYWVGYRVAKHVILGSLAMVGRDFPYKLHRPVVGRERQSG